MRLYGPGIHFPRGWFQQSIRPFTLQKDLQCPRIQNCRHDRRGHRDRMDRRFHNFNHLSVQSYSVVLDRARVPLGEQMHPNHSFLPSPGDNRHHHGLCHSCDANAYDLEAPAPIETKAGCRRNVSPRLDVGFLRRPTLFERRVPDNPIEPVSVALPGSLSSSKWEISLKRTFPILPVGRSSIRNLSPGSF